MGRACAIFGRDGLESRVIRWHREDVDARDKRGHDEGGHDEGG
jgi:hypothetical protein